MNTNCQLILTVKLKLVRHNIPISWRIETDVYIFQMMSISRIKSIPCRFLQKISKRDKVYLWCVVRRGLLKNISTLSINVLGIFGNTVHQSKNFLDLYIESYLEEDGHHNHKVRYTHSIGSQ